MNAAALEIRDLWLSRSSGEPLLRGVSLSVAAGERFGWISPEGFASNALVQLLKGERLPDRGEIRSGGSLLSGADSIAGRIGWVSGRPVGFQNRLAVLENLLFHAFLKAPSPPAARQRAVALLEQVGLAEASGRPLHLLSQGEILRLGIARALLGDPAILLLDGLPAGMDPWALRELFEWLGGFLDRSFGGTLLLRAHGTAEINRLCGRAVLLKGGSIVWEGKGADFRPEALPA